MFGTATPVSYDFWAIGSAAFRQNWPQKFDQSYKSKEKDCAKMFCKIAAFML